MHILKIIHGYPPLYNAGSEVYSQSICHELGKTHQISILTREENPFAPDFNFRTEAASPTAKKFIVNMPRAKDGYRHKELDTIFSRLLEELEPDIAHIGHLNHLSTGIVDVLKAKNVPIVFTLHDFWLMCPRGQFLQRNFGGGKLYELCHKQDSKTCASKCYRSLQSASGVLDSEDQRFWEAWVDRRMAETKHVVTHCDLMIAPSHYLRDRFIQEFGVPEEKITYLDYGFPREYLCNHNPKKDREYTFGYIGTHIPAKGIQHLIYAFSKLQGQTKLRIWGRERGQETNALKSIAKRLGVENRIEWMGEYVNSNIAQAVFSYCDSIVVPSIWGENSPLVIHEAQSCRVPVITADFGGMKEYVNHQVNGLLFEHRNPDSLAEQMQWAMDNPDRMKKLGNRGYLYSHDGNIPGIEEHCEQLETIYSNLVRQKNGK